MSVFAYFIGGPADLTKQALRESCPPGVIRIPETDYSFATAPARPGPSTGPAYWQVRVHLYRLMGVTYDRAGNRMAVYQHDEDR